MTSSADKPDHRRAAELELHRRMQRPGVLSDLLNLLAALDAPVGNAPPDRLPALPPSSRGGQKPPRRRDPPRNDYREDDALLYPEIDAMLDADPHLTATGAARRLIAASPGKVKGTREERNKVRRLVKGYLQSRREMRHRPG